MQKQEIIEVMNISEADYTELENGWLEKMKKNQLTLNFFKKLKIV